LNKIKVKFLGSGDAFGTGGRLQTCIYIESDDTGLLLDCGASALISMKQFGVRLLDIDSIFITHLHGDHFGGIPFFILDSQLISRRTDPLLIAGPPGMKKRVLEAMEVFFPGSSRVKQKFEIIFEELPPTVPTRLGAVNVTAYSAVHGSGAPSYALRVEVSGKTIVYSGDTEWTGDLIEAVDGADVFICEAYFYDKKMKNHLNYQTLMDHHRDLNCKKIIVTHMSEDMLTRRDRLELEHAEDGKTIVL
jgi:ribonuclease BN (tRNA processing enzyme)